MPATQTAAEKLLAALAPEEKEELISAARAAAVGTAQLWDALRTIESNHEVTIEATEEFISILAGDLDSPPSFDEITEETVILAMDSLDIVAD